LSSPLLHPAAVAAFVGRRVLGKMGLRRPQPVAGIDVLHDTVVRLRDGVSLSANVYLPTASTKRCPVLVAMTPYGKDELPERYDLFRMFGIDVGPIATSDYAPFEAPDPGFWVPNGYVVVHADARGMWKSEGIAQVFSKQNGLDFYDLVEWAAAQPWSTGAVGLTGVSYLAWSQWMCASLRPPHLRAINPWEGFTDAYRELAFHGGLPEIGLTTELARHRFEAHYNRSYGIAEHVLESMKEHPFDDAYWADKRPHLEAIDVPALVCASWSDQGLHTRGSLLGFERIASKNKWLFAHGRRKWEVYFSDEAKAAQKRFFDHFLRGVDNGMARVPRVRLEVRRSIDAYDVREESAWPVAGTRVERLYLDASTGSLTRAMVAQGGVVRYRADRGVGGENLARFDLLFERDAEITGPMRLHLYAATESADDFDLFVAVRKIAPDGSEVRFFGYSSNRDDMVAKGWLRASHRELDIERSTEIQPVHLHRRSMKVTPGEPVVVDVEILASSTLFERGSRLRLEVLGHEPNTYPILEHAPLPNQGVHRLYTGGAFDSYVAVPFVEPSR
jgi:uncharacterized protein